jgi:hypothetical protein
MRRSLFVLLVTLGVCTAATAALAQPALPLGKSESGRTSSSQPAEYRFVASSAGVLVIAAHGDGDLSLEVLDEDGQTVADGSADRDLNGSLGTEQFSVILGEAGAYRVQVKVRDNSPTRFEVGAAWVPFPAFERPGDPDRRPAQARTIQVGRNQEDTIEPETGDYWDWFVITPNQSGVLTVIVRPVGGDEPDLKLELFTDGDYSEAQVSSDQDLQGNTANESATLDVRSGQQVHVKVSGVFSSTSGRYRVSSSLIR